MTDATFPAARAAGLSREARPLLRSRNIWLAAPVALLTTGAPHP